MQYSGVFNAQKFLVYKKKGGAFLDEDDHLKTSNLGRCHFDTETKKVTIQMYFLSLNGTGDM